VGEDNGVEVDNGDNADKAHNRDKLHSSDGRKRKLFTNQVVGSFEIRENQLPS